MIVEIQKIEEEKSSISGNFLWVVSSSVFRRLLTFASSIIISRILTPEDFGIISMAATFSYFVEFSSQIGTEAFLISRQDLDERDENTVNIINIAVGLAFALLMIALSPLVADLYKTPQVKYILVFAALSFLINSVFAVPRALLLKNMKQDVVSRIEIFQSCLNVGLVVAFALFGFGYLSFILPLLIANLVICPIYLFYSKIKVSNRINTKVIANILEYCRNYMPKTVLSYLVYNSDYVFIGYLLGPKLLGFYYFGFEKALLLAYMVSGISGTMIFPMFAKCQMKNNKMELKELFLSILRKQTFIVYPFIFLQILLAKEVIHILYGSKWANSVLTFQLILGYSFLQIIATNIHILFDAIGKPEYNLSHFKIITPVCIFSLFIGTKLGGLQGASIAAFIVHSFSAVFLILRASNVFSWGFLEIFASVLRSFIPLVIQSALLFPAVFCLNCQGCNDAQILLIIIPISAVMYLSLSRIFLKDTYNSLIPLVQRTLIEKFNLKPIPKGNN